MILLATFMSYNLLSPRVQVPSIEVVKIKVPYQTDSSSALGKYSYVKTRALCEAMGRSYQVSLLATLPSNTTLVMSCVSESLSDYEALSPF